MTPSTKKEIKWFVKELIKLREKIDGYHTPIDFKLKDLEDWEKENKIQLPEAETKDRATWMLNEIKKHYIKTQKPSPQDILNFEEEAEVIKIEGYTTKMLREYLNSIKEGNSPKKEEIKLIKFKTKGKDFELDTNNGNFKLGDKNGQFNPSTQEFKILYKLAINKNNIVRYNTLLEILDKKENKSSRNYIATKLKETKHEMGILPKNRRNRNPDIFENKSGSGYQISEDKNP